MNSILIFSLVSGFFLGTDLYYEMNSVNLNTMNSYIIPVETKINPEHYDTMKYKLQKTDEGYSLKSNFDGALGSDLESGISIHVMSSYLWIVIEILIICFLAFLYNKRRQSWPAILFEWLYESMRDFFEEILWKKQKYWIKSYVVTLFFTILISNLIWLINDIIRFFVPWWLRNVTAPTSEFEFNIALALISVVITLFIQYKALGLKKFLNEYFPITGKGLIEWPWIWAKIGDIIISLFVAFLDIIGTFAKVVSLSMRLFGNMSSWWILLNVAFLGLWWLTVSLIGINIPAFLPIIVYVQWLLVAVVQAFVFSLLVAIFIKMADEWESVIADEEHYQHHHRQHQTILK